MNFYVYEDDKNKQVRVHAGSCKHCKEGQGTSASSGLIRRWHGPYATLAEAQVFALSLKKRSTTACLHCLAKVKPAYTW